MCERDRPLRKIVLVDAGEDCVGVCELCPDTDEA